MSAPLNKQKLYNLVWSKPITEIAKQYGLSDRGLGKLCERNSIPVPPRGYWAKIYAGQKIKKPPLIVLNSQESETIILIKKAEFQAKEEKLVESKQLPSEIQEAIEKESLPANHIKVPKALHNPHSVIAGWIREDEARDNRYSLYGLSSRTKLSKAELRIRRILSSLLKALEARGFQIETNNYYQRQVGVVHERDKIQLQISEHRRHIRRELTAKEKENAWNKDQKWTTEMQATGFLKLRLIPEYSSNKIDFIEGLDKPLDSQLNSVVAKIIEQIWFTKKRRLEREEEEHQRWLEWHEEERQKELLEAERKKKKKLLKDSLNWRRAKRIRQYVKAAEGRSDSDDFMKWKEWALAYANELDPLISKKP